MSEALSTSHWFSTLDILKVAKLSAGILLPTDNRKQAVFATRQKLQSEVLKGFSLAETLMQTACNPPANRLPRYVFSLLIARLSRVFCPTCSVTFVTAPFTLFSTMLAVSPGCIATVRWMAPPTPAPAPA